MFPPFLTIVFEDNKEYFAGFFLNELSECHKRLPKLNILLGSFFLNTFDFLSIFETSANFVENLRSLSFVIFDFFPERSIFPKYSENLTCSSSVSN